MIEANQACFNMFDGELQYQTKDLVASTNFRIYVSSYGFSQHYTLAVF